MSALWRTEDLKAANVALYERFDHLPAEHADAQVLQCECTALRAALEDVHESLCRADGCDPQAALKIIRNVLAKTERTAQ